MSNQSKNPYVKKARQKSLMGTDSASHSMDAKHDIKKTAMYTGRDLLLGLGGGLAGAVVGRSSLLIGIVVTGAGHFLGSPSTAIFGAGMMASGGYQTISGAMNGTEKEGMEGVKERFENFKNNLKHQLFLDKILPAKKTGEEKTDKEDGTSGMGEVQYFTHPSAEEKELQGSNKELDFREADRIEEQLHQSAEEHAKKNGISGNVSGTEHDSSLEGEEDRLF